MGKNAFFKWVKFLAANEVKVTTQQNVYLRSSENKQQINIYNGLFVRLVINYTILWRAGRGREGWREGGKPVNESWDLERQNSVQTPDVGLLLCQVLQANY